jgi:hypothetical protein
MRGVKKENLPEKLCERCGKPMVWRKKWEKTWDQVKFCSEKCRRTKDPKAGGFESYPAHFLINSPDS